MSDLSLAEQLSDFYDSSSIGSVEPEDKVFYESADGQVLHVATVVGKITPKEIWEQKDVWFDKAQKSREVWDKMPDEGREALDRMVTGAIERMHDRVDEWLPEGLHVEGGNYIDVHLRFLFTDIDKEIDRNEQATSFQIKAAAEATKQALMDLDTPETA